MITPPKHFLFSIFLLITCSLFAQSGPVIYTSDTADDVSIVDQAVDPYGNIYSVGDRGDSVHGVYLSQTDFRGNVLWELQFSDSNYIQYAYALAADENSVYVAGEAYGLQVTGYYTFISRFSKNGDLLWQMNVDTPWVHFSDVVCLDDGGCVVVGSSTGMVQCGAVVRLDSSGNVQWNLSNTWTTEGACRFNTVTVDEYSNIFVCGSTASGRAAFTKISPAGNVLWNEFHMYTGAEMNFTSCVYNEGAIYVAGTLDITSVGDPLKQVIAILDTAGGCNLLKIVSDSLDGYSVRSITRSTANTYFVCGGYAGYGFLHEFDANLTFQRGLLHQNVGELTAVAEFNDTLEIAGIRSQGSIENFSRVYPDSLWSPGCGLVPHTVFAPSLLTYSGPLTGSLDTFALVAGTSQTASLHLDQDSCVNFTGVEDEPAQAVTSVYPNPAVTSITVVFGEALSEQSEIFLINTLGEKILREKIPANTTSFVLDLSGLSSGLYYLLNPDGTAIPIEVLSE